MRIAIQQEIARGEESRYDHRPHGLLLVAAGQSSREVAELFGENGTTVQRWVVRFEQGGLDALREGELAGRPRTLEAKDWRRLQGDLCKTPRDFGLAATLWDGLVLSEHLRRRYGVDLRERQCQRLFRHMGFRLRKPRPQVAQSDPLKVAAVKKLRRLARRADVERWSLDECHFPHTARWRMWHPPEIRDPILAARTNPKIRGVLRRRQLEHRSVRAHDVRGLQRPDFPAFPQSTAVPANARAAHDPCTRQCPSSPCATPGPVPASPCPTPAAAVPAALQPAACPDRAGLETDPAPRDARPHLRNAARRLEGRQHLLRPVVSAEHRVATIMLHYLRCCV